MSVLSVDGGIRASHAARIECFLPSVDVSFGAFSEAGGAAVHSVIWMVALYPIGYRGGITHTIELPVAGDNHDLPDIGGAAPSNQPDVHVLRPVGFQLGLMLSHPP